MKKYDYKVVTVNTMFKSMKSVEGTIQEILDDMSKKGWELHTFTSYDMGSKVIVILKKELM